MQTTDGNLSVHARKLEEAELHHVHQVVRRTGAEDGVLDHRRRAGVRSSGTSTTWKPSFGRRASVKRPRHSIVSSRHEAIDRGPVVPDCNGIHVGIIMDGNGRWAACPRAAAHGGTSRRRAHGARDRRSGDARRRRHAHALRVLVRQLEPPDARGRRADAAAPPVAARSSRSAASTNGVRLSHRRSPRSSAARRSLPRSKKPRRSRRTGAICTCASPSTTRRASRSCRRRRAPAASR